jgi:hypothetical protein
MDGKKGPRLPLDRATAAVVLAAVVIVTVAVVAPGFGAVDEESRALARADVNAIGVALRAAMADSAAVAADAASRTWLYGPGVLPGGNAFARGTGFPISGFVATNPLRSPGWRGPYLDHVPIDPWGRAYVARIEASRPGRAGVVVSAGPDGVLDTTPDGDAIAGDDVGILLVQ